MADIFNRSGDTFGGAISADGCQLTFTDGYAGLLVQNLTVQYQQTVNRIWEIGSKRTYYIAGRPSGTVAMARIVGPRPLPSAFLARFGDVCSAADNVMKISGAVGCGETGGERGQIDLVLSNVVFTMASYGVTMADMVVNMNLSGIFTTLRASEAAS